MKDSTIKDSKVKDLLTKISVLIFWLIVWQVVYLIVQRDLYVPSPFSVFLTLRELIFKPAFWHSIAHTILRVLIGLVLSIAIGVVLGVISSANRYIFQLVNPMMSAIKSTPVMSFIIIALIWFSSSNVPIFICFLMCFPIIWTNVVEGIGNVDKKLLEMSRVYRVKKWVTLKRIYLPAIIPYLMAACLTALGLGWKVVVAAEVLSHPRNSIGSHLYSAKVYLDSSELFAWTLVVILLSFFFESLFARIIRRRMANRRRLSSNINIEQ